jgi:hypothetical protein
MELLVKPEILTSYVYKLSCGTFVCKHLLATKATLITDGI